MSIWSLAAVSILSGLAGQPSPQVEVRVAVVAYEDFHSELRRYEQLLGDVAKQDPSLRFRVAAGSYADVLNWIDRRLVDVAIMTPGVFARMLPEDGQDRGMGVTYLATLQHPGAKSRFASAERREERFHSHYRSVCLVPETSSLRSIADIRAAMERDECELFFVHPLSASGHVVPAAALRQSDVPLPARRRFTYSHSQSIRALEESAGKHDAVAFVWDDAISTVGDIRVPLRRIAIPELDHVRIPHDVIAARTDFEHVDRLRSLFAAGVDSGFYRLKYDPQWRQDFSELHELLSRTEGQLEAGQNLSVDDIGQLLLQYARAQPRPPRLAVVFSGGGAKCSYQVGVISALEERLAELRADNPGQGLDIGMVVGTSGGAINSIPVALGITRTKEGRDAFARTWMTLDQREIVRPPLLVRANTGLWFATVQAALLIVCVRRFEPREERRGKLFAICFAVLAAIEIAIGYIPGTPWAMLGTNHVVHHIWLWITFGVRTSAWTLLIVSLGALGLQGIKSRRGKHINIPRWLTKTTLIVGLLGLPLLQVVTILAFEDTLSGGQGIEKAISRKLPDLVDAHLAEKQLPLLEHRGDSLGATGLQHVSRQIVERGLLQRDLVITGSCLDQTDRKLPSDLYFFAHANPGSGAPPFGASGQSLEERPDLLLDVVLGSGSIFPLFPPRTIKNFPSEGESVQLVDGGFAHNSPIEAAVLWGATHIVLVEATPRHRSERGNFFRNLTSSFHHLHQQAQLLDARSRDKVTVFSLSPEPPHMCVLDFADNLIEDSINRGYRDTGVLAAEDARFRKEFGQPAFVSIGVNP